MNDKIEAMIIMAKGKTGRALEDVIDRILSQPEIFVFGEFIEMANVQQVRKHSKRYLCQLFTYSLFLIYSWEPLLSTSKR